MKDPFVCISCGYETLHRSCMYNHFYKKKKPCPKSKSLIELTDEIKQHILANKVYLLPEKVNAHCTINYNIMNNYLSNMDVIEKLTKYVDYNQIELINFEQSIEEKFNVKAKRLENGTYKYGFELKSQDFLEIIDEISNVYKTRNWEEFNILYDRKLNKLKLYEEGLWQESLVNSGIRKIILTIQEYYLDYYECYLVRTMENNTTSQHKKQAYTDLLKEYYKFIASFDIPPFIKDRSDNEIISTQPTNEYQISDKYFGIYSGIFNNITRSETNVLRKNIMDIIKRNTLRNIEDMNEKVLQLLNVEPNFKELIENSKN